MSPGRIDAKDLPAELRRQVIGEAKVERRQSHAARPGRPVPTGDPAGGGERSTWRCHHCRALFRAWAPAERHGNQRGHGWIEQVYK